MTCFSCFVFCGMASQKGITAPPSKTTGVDVLPLPDIDQAHFDKFSKDGRMDCGQFKDFCKENEKAYALEEPEIVAAFVKLDHDGNGHIDFAEFQRWFRLEDGRAGHLRFESAAMQRRVSDAVEAFKREVGSSMRMSEAQFELHCCKNGMAGRGWQGAKLRAIFQSLDKDSDNNIDFSEYLRWRLKDSPFESDHHYNQKRKEEELEKERKIEEEKKRKAEEARDKLTKAIQQVGNAMAFKDKVAKMKEERIIEEEKIRKAEEARVRLTEAIRKVDNAVFATKEVASMVEETKREEHEKKLREEHEKKYFTRVKKFFGF